MNCFYSISCNISIAGKESITIPGRTGSGYQDQANTQEKEMVFFNSIGHLVYLPAFIKLFHFIIVSKVRLF